MCATISTSSGIAIPWVDKVKYLGIFVVRSHTFRCESCDLDHAKKSFYRSANAIFGKVGRAANEEVVVQLLVSKYIPILMYGLEACPLIKSQLLSLDFAVNRFL